MLGFPDELAAHVRPYGIQIETARGWLLTGDSWAPTLCTAINAATHEINLAAYSISTRWKSGQSDQVNVLNCLLAAPKRGVECNAIIATHRKHGATSNFNWRAVDLLLQAGWNLRRGRAAHLLHAKMMLIDNLYTAIGSHNLCESASSVNVDLSIFLQDRQTAAAALKWFQNQWQAAR